GVQGGLPLPGALPGYSIAAPWTTNERLHDCSRPSYELASARPVRVGCAPARFFQERFMTRWLAAVALGTALACQTGASSQGANATLLDDPAARRLMVTLIELSVGPTPVGLPEHLTVAARALPNAGESVEVAWQALD